MQTLYHGFVHFNIHKAITYCQVDEIFLMLPMAFWYIFFTSNGENNDGPDRDNNNINITCIPAGVRPVLAEYHFLPVH